MTPQPFVLRLNGPACSGKSTLEQALAEKITGMYTIAYDRMKRQLAGYDGKKDGPLVDDLAMGLFEIVCRKQIPILLDFYFVNEPEYLACRRTAEGHGYVFFDLALTAPMPVLIERFYKRREEPGLLGIEALKMSEQEFIERAERKFYLPPGTPVFDSSTMAIPGMVQEILEKMLPARV